MSHWTLRKKDVSREFKFYIFSQPGLLINSLGRYQPDTSSQEILWKRLEDRLQSKSPKPIDKSDTLISVLERQLRCLMRVNTKCPPVCWSANGVNFAWDHTMRNELAF